MTLHDELEVCVDIDANTVTAGRAQFHRSRGVLSSTTFQYDPDYLAHSRAYAIDPKLPLVSGTQQTNDLPGAFADSAPDRWGRNLILKRELALARVEGRRPRNFDNADYLTEVSDTTRQGALRFRRLGSSECVDSRYDIPRPGESASAPARLRCQCSR